MASSCIVLAHIHTGTIVIFTSSPAQILIDIVPVVLALCCISQKDLDAGLGSMVTVSLRQTKAVACTRNNGKGGDVW